MKVSALFPTIALLAAQAHGACTRVADAEGDGLSEIEPCPVERDAGGVPTGRLFCAGANAWLRNGFNWGSRVSSPDRDVVFRIVPLTETGTLDPVYYACPAGTDDEFVQTREGTFGAASASVVA